MSWDIETDVAVVGGGGAGLMAASTAGVGGRRCRRDPARKGFRRPLHVRYHQQFHSGSGHPAAASRRHRGLTGDHGQRYPQKERPQERSRCDAGVMPPLRRDDPLVHRRTRVSTSSSRPRSRGFGHTNKRMHSHPTRIGVPIVDRMREYFTSLDNATYHDKTPGTGWSSMTRVRSWASRRNEAAPGFGSRPRKVVLTTGGFNANREMLAQYIPDMADAPTSARGPTRAKASSGAWKPGPRWIGMTGYQGRATVFSRTAPA